MPYRICMVLVGKLPALPTKGGAVETLARHLLDENEKAPQVEFTVLSMEEPQAVEQAKSYRYARFVWFRPYPLWNKLWWRVRTLGLKLGREELPFPYQRVRGAAWLRRHWQEFDCILAESELEMIRQAGVPPEKVLYHLHWVGRPTPWRDSCFSTLIAVSGYVARGWMEQTGRREDSVRVLYNGIDTSRFCQQPGEDWRGQIRAKWQIPQDRFTVLCCGRIIPGKGFRELIQAMALLRQPTALIVAGGVDFGVEQENSFQKELRQLAEQSGQQVVFTGFIPNDELPQYYAAADLVAIPSTVQDAAPLVPIEAMAMGRPILATRAGGIPEYVGQPCGRIVEVDDQLVQHLAQAINQLRQNPELLRSMAEQGPIQAQRFTTQNYYHSFLTIIEEHLRKKQEK